MIEIREVKTKRDVKKFAKYPIDLYKDCPYYVPSIYEDELTIFNPKKNFNLLYSEAKGFLCYKDGKLVGRIAGLINNVHNKTLERKHIRFSRFDCIDDLEVFKALLGAVEKFGKENGAEVIHGPWGFTDQDREGLLTDGFDLRSTYVTNYAYPYFYKNLEKLGFEDESKWSEMKFTVPDEPYERIEKFAEKIKQRLHLVDISDTMSVSQILKNYGDQFFETLNDSYGHLDGYIPVEGKARETLLSQFAMIVNKRYISILVDEKDNVAGFAVVFPSICDAIIKHRGRLFPFGFIDVLRSIKKPKELEMALIGVKKEYKNSGINAIMISKIERNVIADGIKHIESNPMLETNLSIRQQWKFAENEIIKKRQTYKKEIGSLIQD